MLASLCGVCLFLTGGMAAAQSGSGPTGSPWGAWQPSAPVQTLSFRKEASKPALGGGLAPQGGADSRSESTRPAGGPALSFRKEATAPTAAPSGPALSSPHQVQAVPVSAPRLAQPQPPQPIERTRYPDARAYGTDIEEEIGELPGRERLFRLESEAALQERIRQQGRKRVPMERIFFPEEPVVSKDAYQRRNWPVTPRYVEPNYVCYGRLLFEEKNSERYGWDLGLLQPLVSAGVFFADVVALPYHIATSPCRWYECSAGYCLPGDPVPYMLYPPELSATGAVVEAGAVLALIAIFP